MRFGPRWRALKQLDLGAEEALARIELQESFAADLQDYALHPALLDIATGCAMNLIPGYAEQEVAQKLWAPLSYKRFNFQAALPARFYSWIRLHPDTRANDGFAVFDVSLITPDGQVIATVDQLTLRRLDGALQVPADNADVVATTVEGAPLARARKPALSPGETALLHNSSQGIEPAEGTAALLQLIE